MGMDSDTKLVRRCLAGESDVFTVLIDKYQKPIFNAAYRLTSGYDDACEITQSVFVKAFEKLDTYNSDYAFFSWLYRIVINESLNYIKQQQRLSGNLRHLSARSIGPVEDMESLELDDMIQQTLHQLEYNYRIVIVMKHFIGFSYREMSRILDLPEKTVKSRLYTARQLMKDILTDEGYGAHVGT